MELPSELKTLYRHWPKHTQPQDSVAPPHLAIDKGLLADIEAFTHERMRIWEKKTHGEATPFTDDPILSTYRFCNIYRELDKQTILFHKLLAPLRNDFPLWLLNMFYCRMVARPETIHTTGLLSFDSKENARLLRRLLATKRPRFGTPYVFPVSTIQRSTTPTRETFIAEHLSHVMENIARKIATWKDKSVYSGVEDILPLFGFNHQFLWTEVLIDVAYQYPEHINLFARFPIGPGSAPTMKRLAPNVDPSILVSLLTNIPLDTELTCNGIPVRLSAENWEGIGCEFRKYTNLKNGTGRKRKYN